MKHTFKGPGNLVAMNVRWWHCRSCLTTAQYQDTGHPPSSCHGSYCHANDHIEVTHLTRETIIPVGLLEYGPIKQLPEKKLGGAVYYFWWGLWTIEDATLSTIGIGIPWWRV